MNMVQHCRNNKMNFVFRSFHIQVVGLTSVLQNTSVYAVMISALWRQRTSADEQSS